MSFLPDLERLTGATIITTISDGFQNKVFEARWNGRKIIIRLSEKSRRPLEQLLAEMEWLDYLAGQGIRVAKVIHHPIEITDDDIPYFAVFFEHTDGRPVNVQNLSEWNEEFFERWGKGIALLHNAGAPKLSRPTWLWENDLEEKTERTPWLKIAYDKIINNMEEFNHDQHCFGLIHNDLHTGNFHIVKKEVVLFDFDDCTYHFYAQDLAVSIYHALWTGMSYYPEWNEFPDCFLASFLKGYSSERALQPDMFEQLLECLKMREVFLFTLFREKWNLESIEEWQRLKLIDLEESIQKGKVPFEKELLTYKGLFYAK
ncbi:phosphotransferase enzyme family protein [Chungangia koreensis]|uniref:Phosphotransferase enzyme family protein n=1 Tax=Chungangia koreensis TaxID=752657 RepID=A0ABV8XBI0_9LACT